jgi:hypothetical protein
MGEVMSIRFKVQKGDEIKALTGKLWTKWVVPRNATYSIEPATSQLWLRSNGSTWKLLWFNRV